MTWSSLLDNLHQQQTQIGYECNENDYIVIANEIHSLLDHLPWDNDGKLLDYTLISGCGFKNLVIFQCIAILLVLTIT